MHLEKKKVKIVRIITRLNIGGPAIHVILLSTEIDKDMFDTYLLSGRPESHEGDMSEAADKKGLGITYVPELSRDLSLKDITAFFKIFTFIVKMRPDIVHTHTAKAGALGRMAAIFAGVPVKIHTFHGHVFDGYFSPLKTRVFIAIEKSLAFFTDRVIVVSDSVKKEIVDDLKIVPDRKCSVIKLGFDLDKFLNNDNYSGLLRAKLGLGEDAFIVGIVGRLVPIKNHMMFLHAVRKTIDAHPGKAMKFLVVGDGEMRGYLEEESRKLGLEKYVIFTGWIKDVAMVYADLDVVVLTSLNEGTPVSLIEAMASSRPVVATAVGGVVDIVKHGENGYLVGSNNANEFSERVSSLLGDKEKRKSMGAAGREFARTNFHKGRLIKEIETLYEECLNGRSNN